MKDKLNKILKSDFLPLSIIFIIMIIFFSILKENIYSPFSDIGREFYIPTEILKGKVLYKDIFNVYSPLGYFLNALIILVFKNNLNTFYNIGFVLSFLTLIPVYLITKTYTNKIIASSLSIFILSCCTFFPSISNWITPYSYSIMYALSSILWAFYFLLKYKNYNETKYLFLSCLLYGASLSFKYEYICFIFIILLCLILKKENLFNYLKSIFYILIFPILSLIILLVQHCNLKSIIEIFTNSYILSKDFSVNYFYHYSGISFDNYSFQRCLTYLLHPSFSTLFFFLSILSCFILLFSLVKKEKNQNFILLLVCAILTSIKSIGGISFEIYGTYFFPLLFIALIVFLYDLKLGSKIISVLCIILFCFYSYFDLSHNNFVQLQTQKGNIKIPQIYSNSTIKLLNYLKDKNNFLILPEGALINYLTNSKSDDKLFYLIPPNMSIFNEEYIKNRVSTNNLQLILISNIQYPWYKETSFSKGWGYNINNYLKNNYKDNEIIGNDLQFYVYKI